MEGTPRVVRMSGRQLRVLAHARQVLLYLYAFPRQDES